MSATAQSNANFITQITDLADCVGKTPLVKLNRLPEQEQIANGAVLLAKLEGNNPAGSVKDRPAFNMIYQAEQRGDIKPGDMLIEATSGNTGIALAMVAAMRGYPITLFMPTNSTQERKDAMAAYGATLIEVDEGIEASRDMALQMQADSKAIVLDQFNNPDNKQAHYLTTGPELWAQTDGKITHFISSMGTTGTITGVAQYLKEQNPDIKVIGLQPDEEASIAGMPLICPVFLKQIWLMTSWMLISGSPKFICVNWRKLKAFLLVCHQVQRHGPLPKSQKQILMP